MVVKSLEGLDPYAAWLGVRQPDRPLNAYQLLKLRIGERDATQIEKAAAEQRRMLGRYRAQADETTWHRVRNDLESAIATLLNPEEKTKLEQSLGVWQSTSAPAMSISMIECAACEQTNGSDRRFCSGCGASLWQKCLKCSHSCAVHEVFCGSCGANLRELLRDRIAQIDAAMRSATELRGEGAHDKAIKLLAALPEVTHEILEKRRAQAQQFAQEIAQERDRLRTEAEDALRMAEQRYGEFKYKEVIQLLQALPATNRGERATKLLETATAAYREIKQLRTEIAADVEAKRLSNLAPKIESYLALQPHDEQVRALAEKVREHLLRNARVAMEKCEYEQARRLLESLPASAHNDEVQKLLDVVWEVCRLAYELRHSARVDDFLMCVAQRLKSISPADVKVPKILEELTKRKQAGPTDTRFPRVAWSTPPKRNYIGMSVEWLGGFRRIRAAGPEVDAKLRKSPGIFFVATGLALQGLECAALPLNLLPESKSGGLFGKISLFQKKRVARAAWGIDLGGASLKVVKLVRNDGAPEVSIAVAERIAFQMPLGQPSNDLERADVIRKALFELKSKIPIGEDEPVCINGPNAKVLGRFFSIPAATGRKFDELVLYEATHQIPYPLADLVWDYAVLEPATAPPAKPEDDGAGLQRIVLAALRTHDVRDRLRLFEEAALAVHAIQVDSVALHNFVAYDCFDWSPVKSPKSSATSSAIESVALLDIGSDTGNLLLSAPSQMWFRTIRLGGDDISQSLVRQLKLTFSQAEAVKARPTNVQTMTPLLDAVDTVLARWVAEVQRTLESSAKEICMASVDRLWVCGGGAMQHGLLRHLRFGPTSLTARRDSDSRE